MAVINHLKRLYVIHSSELNHYVFSMELIGNDIFINDSSEDEIYYLDITNRNKIKVTKEYNDNNNDYTLTRVTADKKFIAQTVVEGIKKTLIVD